MLQILDARLDDLQRGAESALGDPAAAPPPSDAAGGSPVGEATAPEGTTPLRHGVAGQTLKRGRP
ncbi:hypothetical protein [Amycolatopsis sp. NPDC051061]|uniref:hypothetical protein n=1 Tax=Amycolatopsis sp. NPDC051061 TaxID=3155042 RepID=UPI00341E53E6